MIALAWLRLESPVDHPLWVAAVVVLALAGAIVRPRAVTIVVAAILTVRIAFGQWPPHPGRAASRFGNGFLDFYDVKTPFDPRVHAEMRGVVLVAVFAFVLLTALAVSRRRPGLALAGVLVGAGWPATLAGGGGAVAVGGGILVAALAILAGLTSRRVPALAVPAVAVLALAAVGASASSAVSKSGLVSWQRWDFYNAPAAPVSVQFAWDAQYEGIRFPKKHTRVLEIEAPPRSLFWRAAVLDRFTDDAWQETDPLDGDSLEPNAQPSDLVRQTVHVLALSDTRLVGASVPVSFDAGDAPLARRAPGFAQLPSGLTRGFTYTVESYAPRPTPAELRRSPADYPVELTEPGTFLDVWPLAAAPAFGRPRATFLDAHPSIQRYAPILHDALDVAGSATTPYDATIDLLRWFRQTGGFRYTDHPAIFSEAPLVGFVAETRAGYCQHFAGAMALMLRYLGIPARVAVGFSSGRYDGKKHRWLVTDHDAHAWVEAWFKGYGWLPFDPTPSGRPERGQLSAPYVRFPLAAAPSGAAQAQGPPDTSPGSAHHHGESGTGIQPGFLPPVASGDGSHRGGSLALLVLALLGAVVAAIVVTKFAVRRVPYATRDPRRLAAACRRELAAYLLDQQIEGARSATLHELGALVRYELSVEPDAFVAAATAARFGPPAGSALAARQARRELRMLLRAMRRRLSTRERLRGLVSLRSLGFAA
jgi:transglutaminase-like putative cysteine protease